MNSSKKMISCSACGREIAKTAKLCPQCGAKIKIPVYKKWWFWVIIVVAASAAISNMRRGETAPTLPQSASSPSENTAHTPSNPDEIAAPESISEPDTASVKYGVGTYLVGKDIDAGLYRAVLTTSLMKMGYVERSSGVSMDFADILANIVLTGDGYVEIKETDVAVKLTGVELYPISLDELTSNIKTEVSDGIYLVGYDLEPGTYKVEIEDSAINMAYIERVKSVAMDFSDIIANEVFQGQGYVEIKETDFAVRIQGGRLILQ